MGDYFAILAARVAGAADAVRPLIPARYESTVAVPLVPDGTQGFVETEQHIAAPRPLRQPHLPHIAANESPIPSPLIRPPDSRKSFPPSSDLSPQLVAEKTPPAPEIEQEGHDADNPKRAPAPASAADAGRKMKVVQVEAMPARFHIEKENRPAADIAISIRPRVRVVEAQPVDDSLGAAPRRRRPSSDEALPNEEISRDPSRLVARPIPPPPPAAGRGGTVAKNTPAVQISIGRIEVHAVIPAAAVAPAKHRANPSVVSLENYLARRNAGAV